MLATGLLYAEDYADEIWNHVRSLWDELQTKRLIPDQVDTEVLVQRSSGSIAVRVDRVDSSATQPRWVWMRSGQRDEGDHLKERVMLYALAHQSQHATPGTIAIHYSAENDVRSATPAATVLTRHTAKLDAFLGDIQAREWPLSEGQHCRSCPFNLICPV